jgi:hypothetical protein
MPPISYDECMTNTHRDLAHRIIDLDINNISDEMHDRALDDFADAIDPHLDALRSLAYARHDIACDDHTELDLSNYDDIDMLAFDTDTPLPCLTETTAAIYSLCYSFYRD